MEIVVNSPLERVDIYRDKREGVKRKWSGYRKERG